MQLQIELLVLVRCTCITGQTVQCVIDSKDFNLNLVNQANPI